MNVGEGLTKCFWLEPTGESVISLRRFTFGGVLSEDEPRAGHRNCPKGVYGHDSVVSEIARIPTLIETHEDGFKHLGLVPKALIPAHSDPVWPQFCQRCGEPLRADDQWQANQHELYRRTDNGEEVVIRPFPGKELAGAMYDSWWRHGYADGMYVGPDGIALTVVLPNGGQWEADGPATGGGHWTRTGDPRMPETLTCSPSIAYGTPGTEGYYHGFLQNGVLTAHIG